MASSLVGGRDSKGWGSVLRDLLARRWGPGNIPQLQGEEE